MSTLNLYVLTFNCGREQIDPDRFGSHLFSGLSEPQSPPDILILALQEVAPIAYSFLGGSYLTTYLSRFQHAVSVAATSLRGASYVNIINRNVGMIAIMVFVLRDRTAQIHKLETAGVGVGVQEMGNKGAVGVRLGYSLGKYTLDFTFVSAHLAPMEDGLTRRNEDWKNIVRGLVFEPISPTSLSKAKTQRLPSEPSNDETTPLIPSSNPESNAIPPMSGIYTPTSHLFLAGDLNYRTSTTSPTQIDAHTFPQPSEDESFPRHYWHLLSRDQLSQERRAGRTCHGLSEADVDFPPTYKYSDRARALAGTPAAEGGSADADMDSTEDGKTWLWSTHRWPSWCDRILFLPLPSWFPAPDSKAKIKVTSYKALPLLAMSDHRPVAASFSVPAMAIPEPSAQDEESDGGVRVSPPFELDMRWREKRDWARRRELAVGIGAYLMVTWEGRGILLVVLVGAIGGWIVIAGGLG